MNHDHLIVRCLSCGTKNRIPQGRLQERPICGKCQAPLDDMIIRCLNCGKKNRIPEERINQKAYCGQCGSSLVLTTHLEQIVEVSDDTFYREVLSCSRAVIMDCWAPWCGPCRSMEPLFKELASQYAGGLKFTKLNVDENPITTAQYSIRSIPALLFFNEGNLVNTIIGVRPKEEIERAILTMVKKS